VSLGKPVWHSVNPYVEQTILEALESNMNKKTNFVPIARILFKEDEKEKEKRIKLWFNWYVKRCIDYQKRYYKKSNVKPEQEFAIMKT